MEIANGALSTTTKVWEILMASYQGNLQKVKDLVEETPGLIYAQYNYAPPIHFAVREGHTELTKYLLEQGAHDPAYKFYPFQESLQTVANDRGFTAIEDMLNRYMKNHEKHSFKGDNGGIHFNRSALQKEFEEAVDRNNMSKTNEILREHPEFARDETYFWGEGILTMPAKENHREMIDLLMDYGARVPDILKWTQFYYFERYDAGEFMLAKGMNPNVMSWQHVTILHDMAQKGFLDKARLLVNSGAELDAIDEAYQSTPLGLAVRWGHVEMVEYLLAEGADVNKSGAPWSTPLSWARKKERTAIEQILLKAGAN